MEERGALNMKQSMKIIFGCMAVFIFLSYNCIISNAGDGRYVNYKGFVYYTEPEETGGITILNYKGNKEKITIPTKIHGRKVTAVSSLKGGKKLKQVHIPSGITKEICLDAPNLTKVTVDKNHPKYKVVNKMVVNKKVTQVYACPAGLKKITIPKSVKIIGGGAFSNTKIEMVRIPQNVIRIEAGAFENCKYLKKIIFNKKLKKIESLAFAGCESLETINIPDTVKQMEDMVFNNCTKLKTVELSNRIERLENMFWGCEALKEIKIPKSVKHIEMYALQDNKFVEKVYIYNKECEIYEDENVSGLNAIAPHIIIYGYPGSTAEAYAKRNGNPFVAL